MRLRQAAKIQRWIEEPERYNFRRHPAWGQETVRRSRTVCRRHDRLKRRRLPHLPTDDELMERLDMTVSLFAGLLKSCGETLPPELDALAFDFSVLDGLEDNDPVV